MFGHSPKLPVDLMLARTQPTKLRSYPQFVQDSHKQLTSSYAIAKQQCQAQHMRQKRIHDIKDLQSQVIEFGFIPQWSGKAMLTPSLISLVR